MKRRMADDTYAHVARARRLRRSLVLGGLVLAAMVSTRWVRLNLSPSVPRGIYRLALVPQPLTHGMLVVLPVPASVRPWHPGWVPLLKPIAGLAHDVVCHRDHTLFVNSVDFGPVYQEAHGKPLPQIAEGCFVVPAGHVFLASPAPRSLDGRYLGTTPIAALTAQALPLFPWRLCVGMVILLSTFTLVLRAQARAAHQRAQHHAATFLAEHGLVTEGTLTCQRVDAIFACGGLLAPDHRVLSLRCTEKSCMPH